MAEGGKPLLADGSSNLDCGICLERYKEPKILPCSHTFCLGCLEKTLKRKEERALIKKLQEPTVTQEALLVADGETELKEELSDALRELAPTQQNISCPVCKREHDVPSGGLRQFSVDFEAEQAIEVELLQKSLTKTKLSQKCASCSKERAITSHCDSCGGICQRCSDAHAEFEIFSEHKVVPINELTCENVGLKKRKSHLCSRHGETAKMYCTSCSQVICHVCIVKQHPGHSFSLLEEADEKLKEKVTHQRDEAQKTKRDFEEYKQYIAGVEGEVVGESYNAKLRSKVNKEFDERIKMLQDKRESLVNYIDGYDSLSKKQIWSEKETVELVLNKIQAGLKTVEKAQRCINAADRIAMNSAGSQILDEVSKETWSHESLPHPLVFQRSPDPIITSTDGQWSCDKLAPITENDIQICVVDENGRKKTTPYIGEPTIIEVTFKVGMVEEPKFQILYGKSRQVHNSVAAYEISESKSWNIEFLPRCAGTHFVQVWVGGVAVAIKSDVDINGKPRIGSKVQPGPDWTLPNDTLLYLEGTVTSASLSSVEVKWKQEANFVEERGHRLTLNAATEEEEEEEEVNVNLVKQLTTARELLEQGDADSEITDECQPHENHLTLRNFDFSQLTTTVHEDTTEQEAEEALLSLVEEVSKEKTEDFDFEDYEPRSKLVHKNYQWGGFSGKYEVELIL